MKLITTLKTIVMSEFKGTKGNWSFSRCQLSETVSVSSGLFKVAAVYSYDILCAENDIEETVYNAKIISCAPEMMKMLKLFLKEFEYDGATEYECELFFKARDLIKKATTI
jgi:hypothetical protein